MIFSEQKIDDCPECGAKESAFMGSSEWGHSIACCSDDCGQKIANKIEENTNKKYFKKKLKQYYELQSLLEERRLEGVNAACDPFFKL